MSPDAGEETSEKNAVGFARGVQHVLPGALLLVALLELVALLPIPLGTLGPGGIAFASNRTRTGCEDSRICQHADEAALTPDDFGAAQAPSSTLGALAAIVVAVGDHTVAPTGRERSGLYSPAIAACTRPHGWQPLNRRQHWAQVCTHP